MAGPTTAFQTGVHGSRPAASAGCVLYWCTTHALMYRSDGSAWATFQDLSATGGGGIATDSIWDAAGDLVQGSGANTGAKLTAGTAGQFLMSGGAAAANLWASRELDYVQKTSNTNITATSAATANTVVTANAVSFNGSTVAEIVFFCPSVQLNSTATTLFLWLYDGSSEVGAIGGYVGAAGAGRVPLYVSYRLTPSNASHTYSIRGSTNASSVDVNGGAAGSGNFMPCYVRILRAV